MSLPPVQRFESNTGVRIYRMSCQAFPGLVAHAYVLIGTGPLTLVDTGSGYGDSTPQLRAGLETIRTEFGEAVTPGAIERVLITHGHLDHFGGLAQLAGPVTAEVGIHGWTGGSGVVRRTGAGGHQGPRLLSRAGRRTSNPSGARNCSSHRGQQRPGVEAI
ncbi:MAG: MBL fold metallo-hydrolase [Gemmatimonadales bacterium]